MGNSTKYEQFLSNWLYEHLPESSEWTLISDIDFIICNYKTKRFMLLELKTRWAEIKKWQRDLYKMLHNRLKASFDDWWTYMWVHLIKFQWDNFYDWEVTLDWNRTNEYELQQFLYDNLRYEKN